MRIIKDKFIFAPNIFVYEGDETAAGISARKNNVNA